jgi:hypothetical protein
MRALANVSRMIVDESTLNLLVVRRTSHVLTWFCLSFGHCVNASLTLVLLSQSRLHNLAKEWGCVQATKFFGLKTRLSLLLADIAIPLIS